MDRKSIIEYIYNAEDKLKDEFKKYENICFLNSIKVLDAFHLNKVSESDLNGTLGYGYNDYGRDIVEKVYASVFVPNKEPLELLPVETEREWKVIETILESIQNDSKKEEE